MLGQTPFYCLLILVLPITLAHHPWPHRHHHHHGPHFGHGRYHTHHGPFHSKPFLINPPLHHNPPFHHNHHNPHFHSPPFQHNPDFHNPTFHHHPNFHNPSFQHNPDFHKPSFQHNPNFHNPFFHHNPDFHNPSFQHNPDFHNKHPLLPFPTVHTTSTETTTQEITTEPTSTTTEDPTTTILNEVYCDAQDIELATQTFCNNQTEESFNGLFYTVDIPISGYAEDDFEIKIKHRVLSVYAKNLNNQYMDIIILPSFVDAKNALWRYEDEGIQINFLLQTAGGACGNNIIDSTVKNVQRMGDDIFS